MILNRPARKVPQIDKLNFLADHFDELREMYHVIMEHLKVCSDSQVELPDDLVTYDSDNNVLKSGENTIQISADVPENIVTGDASEAISYDLTESLTYSNDIFGTASFYQIDIPSPTGSFEHESYLLPYQPLGYTNPYTDRHYVCAGNRVLFNIYDLITVNNINEYTSNFLTSSDLPDMSDYVETTEVANEAGKIPRYNSQGHLVLPDGTEIWCESNE